MKGTSFRGGILVMNSVSFLPWVCWSRLMQSRLSSFKLKLTNIQIGETQLETHHLTSNPLSAISLSKNWQDRSKYRFKAKICLINPNTPFFGSDWVVSSWSKIGLHPSKIWINIGDVIKLFSKIIVDHTIFVLYSFDMKIWHQNSKLIS